MTRTTYADGMRHAADILRARSAQVDDGTTRLHLAAAIAVVETMAMERGHPLQLAGALIAAAARAVEDAMCAGLHRAYAEPVRVDLERAALGVREAWDEVCVQREPSDDVLDAWARDGEGR